MDPRLLAASAALNEGRKSEAAEQLLAYLAPDPADATAKTFSILLNLLAELQRTEDGLIWSGRAAERFPRDHEILNLRGTMLRSTGHHIDAIAAFDQAIKLKPKDPIAHFNKGRSYCDLGKGKEAEAVFVKLLRQYPGHVDVSRALARALSLQGKFAAAEARLRPLLAANRHNVDLWLDLSAAAADRSDLDEALAIMDRALQSIPADLRLLHAKIVLLRFLAKRQEATAILTELLPNHGNVPWVLYELALATMGKNLGGAISMLRRAIELMPTARDYRLALAECLLRRQVATEGENVDTAYQALSTVPPVVPMPAYEAKVRAEILTQAADFSAVDQLGNFAALGRLWASDGQASALFPHLARVCSSDDRHALIDHHRLLGDDLISKARRAPLERRPKPRPGSKIRIGFMSSDLRSHPVGYFAWPLFQYADRDRFEIYCYSWFEEGAADETQQRITSMVDAFRWCPLIGSREAAQLIANDDIDILFELGGMTHMSKLDVMAWKPAHLCASWLGYPHSAGLDTIDYLLVDPFLNPPDPQLLIEKPMIMPHSWITMTSLAFPDSLPITPNAPVSRNGFFTFGTANNPYKYNEAMLRTWAQIVARVPNSRFIFVRPEGGSQIFSRNVRAIFQAEGVAPDRIEFRAVRGDHMKHYNDIDIALDTFPQTGGTTTCEAIWMGVPTVTLVGEALFERLSYSILHNAGLADLCATTREDFVEIAVRLADDSQRIQALRTGLRDQIRTGPLGNSKQFAQDFFDLVARTVQGAAAPLPQQAPTA